MSAALPAILLAALAALTLAAVLARRRKGEGAGRAARLVRLVITSVLAAGCAYAFYDRYWIWRGCFNELGRCYDSEAGVMLEQAGPIWGGLFLVFAALALWNLMTLRRHRQS